MRKLKLIHQVAVAFAIVFMSTVLCGAGCSTIASDSGGGGSSTGGGGGVGSGGGGASSTMTEAEAIAAINALQSGDSITIKLDSSVKTISTLQLALKDPNKKVTLDLSQSGMTSIGSMAFYGCSSLTSVEIPDSVTSISTETFHSCASLNTIKYTGRKDDWNTKITSFGYIWRFQVPARGVTCSDGKTYAFVGAHDRPNDADHKLGAEI